MSSPTTIADSTNKRKVDALGDSGDSGRPAAIARLKDATSVSDPSPTTTPHIPPPVWGRVLDFMPYEEVRSALLVGKIIANQAVKYVRVLNFMKSCQLDGPSSRRFASVEEVNCLCLISGRLGSTVLCSDTTTRLVPFLMMFSKLKRIYVGGLITQDWNGQEELVREFYHPDNCSSPANHGGLAKAFYDNFIGTFKARLVPLDFHIKGGFVDHFVNELGLCARSDEAGDGTGTNSEGMCAICRDVCSYLPLDEIVDRPYFCGCAGNIYVFEAISKRKGARELFRKESDALLPRFLNYRLNHFTIEEEALKRRLTNFGMRSVRKGIYYLTMHDLDYLDRLIAVGFDPRAMSKKSLYGSMVHRTRQFDAYAKSTFDALVARGFAFDEADLIVLDERMETALKDLPALIRKGETG